MDALRDDRLSPVDLAAVEIDDEFWSPRRDVNRSVTLWDEREKLESRIDNLRRVAGRKSGGFEGPYHNDPPIYKWIEAACYVLASQEDPELRAEVDALVDLVAAAQDDSGYVHAYTQLEREVEDRWTNLATGHELFAVGHLVEAALAHHRLDDESRLLSAARRSADHVCDVFGPDGNRGYPGHPEIELALVRLHRATGVDDYLELARFFVDERGRPDSRFEWELDNVEQVTGGQTPDLFRDDEGAYDGSYAQDHAPIRSHSRMRGHAVMATFLYAGVAEVVAETGDEELWAALRRLWGDMVGKHAYVTGGIGTVPESESFGAPYDLPNEGGYAETCAAFGKIQWNHSLFLSTGDRRFVDDLELTLYNAFLAGVSLDGTRFSYDNPLADADCDHHRQQWFHTSCCPPNVARLLASLERFVYATADDSLFVNLFVGGEVTAELRRGSITLEQTTGYPWEGSVELTVTRTDAGRCSLAVRVPPWAESATAECNGESIPVSDHLERGYLTLTREWTAGDTVSLAFEMPPRAISAHPAVRQDAGQIALGRGPLVYCLEGTDNPTPLGQLWYPIRSEIDAVREPELLGGIVALEFEATSRLDTGWSDRLYRARDDVAHTSVRCRAVPYYAWDNRAPGEMRVWLPASDTPP